MDLCLRAQLKGYKAWYEPRAIIYHVHKATSKRNKSLTEYLQFRNMTMTILKNYPADYLRAHWLKIILVHLHTIWFLITKGFGLPALKAEGYLLFHLPVILRKRVLIQGSKKINIKRFNQLIMPKKLHLFGRTF